MKREDFFEVLGELDDDIVNEAKTTAKNKINWQIGATAAACLALVLSAGLFLFHSQRDKDITIEHSTADAAPMVYVNDTLYIQSGDQQGYPESKDEFIYLGRILSDITNSQSGNSDGIPRENFQANDSIIGCEVYQYGENIVVKINNAYWLYMKYGEPEKNQNDLSETEKELLDPTYNK